MTKDKLLLAVVTTIGLTTWPAAGQAPQGSVRAWGFNSYGQIGIGTETYSNGPVPLSGIRNVLGVAAGNIHTLALKADGTVWAWGDNSSG